MLLQKIENTEIWKDIPEFEGYYQVSSKGRIRRIGNYSNQNGSWSLKNPHILKPRDNRRGYLYVMLSVNGKIYSRYVHRLVAITFLPNPNNYKEVNHKDGNKYNNSVENLEWCDHSYNGKHAYRTGLRTVKGCYGRKKAVAQIDKESKKILFIHESVEKAAKSVGLKNFSSISCCCSYAEDHSRYKRPALSSKGYLWRFATDDMEIGQIYQEN